MRNVLGIVEGRDPTRRHEMVVVGAHLDHDGIDADGRIYNGADDNASGTAAVLGGGRRLRARRGERRAPGPVGRCSRSWNGEEKGSLGRRGVRRRRRSPAGASSPTSTSTWSAGTKRCPIPSDWRFRGLPKVDASPRAATPCTCSATATPPSSRPMLRDANEAVGLTLLEDYDEGAQGLLQRSDNWPFLVARDPGAVPDDRPSPRLPHAGRRHGPDRFWQADPRDPAGGARRVDRRRRPPEPATEETVIKFKC